MRTKDTEYRVRETLLKQADRLLHHYDTGYRLVLEGEFEGAALEFKEGAKARLFLKKSVDKLDEIFDDLRQ